MNHRRMLNTVLLFFLLSVAIPILVSAGGGIYETKHFNVNIFNRNLPDDTWLTLHRIDYKLSWAPGMSNIFRPVKPEGSLDLGEQKLTYKMNTQCDLELDWPNDKAYPVTFTLFYKKFNKMTLPDGQTVVIASDELTVIREIGSGNNANIHF